MAWTYLILAGLLECAWAIGLKYADGFTRAGPSVFTVITALASFFMLSLAMRSIPVGTAYAIWTGIGAVGVAILGIVLFGESRELLRLACIFLIVIGIAGLRVFSGDAAA